MADEKKSIFDFTDQFGIESPFDTDWVKMDFKGETKAANASVTLLNQDRVFSIKTDVLIKFLLKGNTSWYNDTEYKVTLTSSNPSLKISASSWSGENDYKLYTIISLDKPAKVSLYISINGVKKHTFEIEFIESKDVFSSIEIKRLTDEYQYMSNFVHDHSPQEYAGNYCMQGADRALGKLFNNKTDFYVVARNTHKVLNSINFNKLNTYSRADQYKKAGYVYTDYAIDSKYWNIDHKEREKINSEPDYAAARSYASLVQYDIVSVNEAKGKSFLSYLKMQIDKKEPGWHVYYLSIVDGFHTQILLIDNSNRDDPKYQIWEDHGLSSSSGDLDNIVAGINRQNSSLFTSSCLFRYQKGTTDKWDNQTVKIWKLKSK